MGVAGAAHEYVQRGKPGFRPGVYADVRFGEQGNASDAGFFSERMQPHIEQGRIASRGGLHQRLFNMLDFIEAAGAPQVYEQVRSG